MFLKKSVSMQKKKNIYIGNVALCITIDNISRLICFYNFGNK